MVFLKWFKYGLNADLIKSFEEAYSLIGHELECINEVVASVLFLGSRRERWARELGSRLRKVVWVKRLHINDVYALVVVDELTNEFIMMMNAVNEVTDAYIDALEIRKFRARDGKEILLARLYI